jgi:hypothetical protein
VTVDRKSAFIYRVKWAMSAGVEHSSDRKGVLVDFLLELDRKVDELHWKTRFGSDRGLDVRVLGDDDVLLGGRGCMLDILNS